MRLAIFSVVLNIHQVGVADELYHCLGDDFLFVEFQNPSGDDKKGGEDDYSSRPYLVQVWKNYQNREKAYQIAKTVDVAVFGGYMTLPYLKERLKVGKLSFEMGERWLKQGWKSFFSPRLITAMWNYHSKWRKKPLYKLCSGGFVAQDQYKLHSFVGKCFRWGYFIEVPKQEVFTSTDSVLDQSAKVSIMWCSRFLDWKHPELVVQLADSLRRKGYSFIISMFGEGEMMNEIRGMIKEKNLAEYVILKGARANETIIHAMRDHDIFIFTSDRREGWGVVANEAMSNKCCLVASNEIGAVPYLLRDGINGLVFDSNSASSLFDKVSYLIDHPQERLAMSEQGYYDMYRLWNPRTAAYRLLELSQGLLQSKVVFYEDGPCSRDVPGV